MAEAMNAELLALRDAGCRLIQIEEPTFHFMANTFGKDHEEVLFLIDAFNREVQGLDDVELWIHTCWGNPNMQRVMEDTSYAASIEIYLERCRGDVWTLEMKDRNQKDIELFAPFRNDLKKKICIGAVSHRTLQADRADEVAGRDSQGAEAHPGRAADRLERLRVRPSGLQPRDRLLQGHARLPRAATSSAAELGLPTTDVPATHPELQIDVVERGAFESYFGSGEGVIMGSMRNRVLSILILFVASVAFAFARQKPKPEDTEVWSPEPKIVTPGADGAAPSDAIVLFDGSNLNEWVSAQDGSPAQWVVADGVLTVNKKAGNIETKRSFHDYQLHLEWREPVDITGAGQLRGNSGVFLASTGKGDAGYELQILDSYNNKTYVNGQAASIYKQGSAARERDAQGRRVAGLRRHLDCAAVQRRWLTEVAGLRHRVPQRRARAEPLRAEGRDALHRRAELQDVRWRPDQAAGARRSEPADQLPEHLGQGTLEST